MMWIVVAIVLAYLGFRSHKARETVHEAVTESSWRRQVDGLIACLRDEMSEKGFVSLQRLRTILREDQIDKLLMHASPQIHQEVLKHRNLKLLAVHLLKGDHECLSTFLRSSSDIDDNVFTNTTTKERDWLCRWKRPDDLSNERDTWMFDEHWKIPPILDQAPVVIYPKDFIPPFYDSHEIGSGAFGTAHTARLGGGHLGAYYDEVSLSLALSLILSC